MSNRSSLAAASVLGLGAALAFAPGAAAAVSTTLTADTAQSRSCLVRAGAGAAGVATTRTTAEATGLVRAKLSSGGDWDLAVFEADTGRNVAGAAGFGAAEVAEGFVEQGQELLVQACRYRGDAARADLSVDVLSLESSDTEGDPTQVVDVRTPARADKARLQGLGLDLTEHGDEDSVEVVVHGRDDAERLTAAGFTYDVEIADLEARGRANRERDRQYAADVEQSALPSGRDGYRRLADYELELKQLAERYPSLTRIITLPNKTVEGRSVQALEITRNAQDVGDGKPIFLNMGVHHAREWPSSEHAMEFAYDLLTNYGKSARTTRLVDTTRTITVPVVNPDGFNISREAGGNPNRPPAFSLFDYEMKRKNCFVSANTPASFRTGTCAANPAGRLRGTDPNRNYGGFWGGPGASTVWSSDTYRGDRAFSEAETQNIRWLQSTRAITNLISNHTYSNLVLRPPGVVAAGFPLEEPILEALGGRMTARNGYTNQPSFELYDTTGGTEDWTFWSAGSLGYTFEIGPDEFHPAFESGVVNEYLGRGDTAGAGKGGNRAAYYEMLESTADRGLHSVVEGTAPAGWRLTLAKQFTTTTHDPKYLNNAGTSTAPPEQFTDDLKYDLVAKGGKFSWHVNPSTRPLVAGRFGRDPLAPPQPAGAVTNPAGIPALNTGNPYSGANEVVPFTVKGLPEHDNAKATFTIRWGDPTVDWDVYVLNSAGQLVAQAAVGNTSSESAVLRDPPAGEYRAVIVNYSQGSRTAANWLDWTGDVRFDGPTPRIETGIKESYKLTCTRRDGAERVTREVVVDRGETADVGNACQTTKG